MQYEAECQPQPDEHVEFVDVYARRHGHRSRSAVICEALRLLRASELAPDYSAAWDEWSGTEEQMWDTVVGDGLSTDE